MRQAYAICCVAIGSILLLSRTWTANADPQEQEEPRSEEDGPRTRFSCHGRVGGYYADIDSGCQLYHLCDGSGRQFTHMCPNQTLFQQRMMVCDHWYMVNCSLAELDYAANLLLGQRDQPFMRSGDHSHHQHHSPGARGTVRTVLPPNFGANQQDSVSRQPENSQSRTFPGRTLDSNAGTISFSISSLPGARPPERFGDLSNQKLELDYKNSRRYNQNHSRRVPVKSLFQTKNNFDDLSSTISTEEPTSEVELEPITERTVYTPSRPLKRFPGGSGTQRFQYTEPDFGGKINSSHKYSGRVITMPVFQQGNKSSSQIPYTEPAVTPRSETISVLHVSSIPSGSVSNTHEIGSDEDTKYNSRYDSNRKLSSPFSGRVPTLPVFQKNTNFETSHNVYKEVPTAENVAKPQVSAAFRPSLQSGSSLDRPGTRNNPNTSDESARKLPQTPLLTTSAFQRRNNLGTSTLRPNAYLEESSTRSAFQIQTEKTFNVGKQFINNSRQFTSTESSISLPSEYRNNPFLHSYFGSSSTVSSTTSPVTTTQPPSKTGIYNIRLEEDFGNHVELFLPDPRRMFFIPDNDADLIGGLESNFSKVLVIPLPSSDHRHGHMRFRSDEKEVQGQNPECPKCHPAFLLPGSCQPCVRIR